MANDAKYKIDIFLLVLPIVSKVSVNSKTLGGGDPVETAQYFCSFRFKQSHYSPF